MSSQNARLDMIPRLPGLRLFASFIMLKKGWYGFVLAMFFFSGLSINAAPYLMGQLASAAASAPDDTDRLWTAAFLFIGCNLVHHFLWHGAEFVYLRRVLPDLAQIDSWLFRQSMQRQYDYFINRFSGKVASSLGTLGREFRELAELIFYGYLQQAIFLPVIIITLLSVNTLTATFFAASLVLMVLISRRTLPVFVKKEAEMVDATGSLSGIVFDAMSNFVNVKAFKAEGHEENLVRVGADKLSLANQGAYKARLIFWSTLSLVVRGGMWPIATVLNVYLFSIGRIGIEEFSTFLATMLLFATSIWATIFQLSDLTKRIGRIEEIYAYLFQGARFDSSPSFTALDRPQCTSPSFERALEIRGIRFAYPDAPAVNVLNDLTIDIRKGEKVGIVGRSGSGKTTLIKLLLGYYEPTHGAISLDGQRVPQGDLIELLSYVPQDTTLFNRTLRDNIAYNVAPELNTSDRLYEVAHKSLASEFIDRLPLGFDTIVGDRGVKLSAGQRQRIAIARALMRDKPIIILDEATSALDSESEHLIREGLENMWQGKTVIAIAHRLSTLQKMDRILVFAHGEIVEQGSHQELLERGGVYKQLWERQVGFNPS